MNKNNELKTGSVYDTIIGRKEIGKALYMGMFNRSNMVYRHALVFTGSKESSKDGLVFNYLKICRFSKYSFEDGKLKIKKKVITVPEDNEKGFLEDKLKSINLVEDSWSYGWQEIKNDT